MEQEKLLKSIKSNLKGLVLSEKNGYTEKKLWGHYMEFIGQDLERESIKLGFSCMADLLDSFRDIIRRGFNQDGEQVYKGIADESTRHMAELIGKTPVTKKKRKGTRGRGSWRGRGMLRGRAEGRGGFSFRGMRGIIRGGPVGGFNGRGWMAGREASNGFARNPSAMAIGVTMESERFRKAFGISASQRNVSFPRNLTMEHVESVKPNIVARSLSQHPGNRFEAILHQYFQKNNLGAIPFKVSSVGNKFTAEVRVNSEVFKTSPQSFGSEAEAVEAVSKLCVNKMNIMKDGSVLEESKDKVMMMYRVEQILTGKKDGVYSTMVEKQYEKKHREQLPSLWWEKVNVVRAEPLSAGSKIMIVYPNEDKKVSIEKDPNGASPSNSYDMLNGFNNEAVSSQNHEGHQALQTEVEFGEEEDRFFHILPDLSPPDDDSWAVYISVVASAEEIYVKFIGDDYSEKFDEVSQMMDRFYDNVNIPSVEEVILEQIYAAKADGEWHRVQATYIEEFSKVSCWFLDCGDEDVIDKKHLKELDEKFLTVPAQAFQISLHGVKDTTENTALIDKINDELVGKSFIAKVEFAGDNEKVPAVILFDTSHDEKGVNMNEKIQEFIDKQEVFVSSDDADSTAASSLAGSLSDVLEDDITAAPILAGSLSDVPADDTTAAPILAGSLSNVPEDDTTAAPILAGSLSDVPEDDIRNSNTEQNHFIAEVLKPLSAIAIPRAHEDFDVRCSMTFSPSNFIVQQVDFADKLDDMMAALAAFYNDPSNPKLKVLGDVKEGEFVAAQHQDGRWYRAKVVREIGLQTGLLVVRFVDYGENSIVRLDKLRLLAPEFRHLPMQAVLAKLAGVHPPSGGWTQEDISWFDNRVAGQDFVSRVTGVSVGVTGEMVMELILIDTSHPEVDKYVAKELMDRK